MKITELVYNKAALTKIDGCFDEAATTGVTAASEYVDLARLARTVTA